MDDRRTQGCAPHPAGENDFSPQIPPAASLRREGRARRRGLTGVRKGDAARHGRAWQALLRLPAGGGLVSGRGRKRGERGWDYRGWGEKTAERSGRTSGRNMTPAERVGENEGRKKHGLREQTVLFSEILRADGGRVRKHTSAVGNEGVRGESFPPMPFLSFCLFCLYSGACWL